MNFLEKRYTEDLTLDDGIQILILAAKHLRSDEFVVGDCSLAYCRGEKSVLLTEDQIRDFHDCLK